jgi:predicted CoA-substrate-specific enzyme activase
MGIDIGSTSSKAVILQDGAQLVATEVVQIGTGSSGPARVLDTILKKTGLDIGDMARIIATGYGRFTFEPAHHQYTEIRCQAKGNNFFCRSARLIIDIGGQDVKAIRLDEKGNVKQFFMNDKCAAGTGRFLEVMSRVMEVEIDQMDYYDERATDPATVSSTCAVFAESEVISQLAAGLLKENIIAGVHQSIASKACALAGRGVIEDELVLCGGVSKNQGVVRAIEKELNRKVFVAPMPQITGALGAAILAYEDVLKEVALKDNERQKG